MTADASPRPDVQLGDNLAGVDAQGIDAVTLLSAFIALLVAVPSGLVVGALGAAGSPAQLVGLAAAFWWGAHRLAQPWMSGQVTQPARRAALILLASVLVSYVVATTRAIPPIEMRAADRGLLMMCSWVGLIILATDGITSRQRLDTLLRRLVLSGGALATLGIVQFLTRRPWTNYIHIPGLSMNSQLADVSIRGGVARPAGTALHPIEFGVVLTMLLPLAIHYAMADGGRTRLRRWYPVLAISLAIPISVSRSAIIGSVVVLAFCLPTWPRTRRRWTYAGLVGMVPVIYLIAPGLIGTMKGLFTGISDDSSAQSRSGSYELAWSFISRAPVFGRGFGTFLPEYRILDNQYLGTMIELGFVGLTALLVLFLAGIFTARGTRARVRDAVTRDLAQCLAASVAAGAVSLAFFDTLGFPMAAGLVFFLLGVVGALRRVSLK